MIFVCLYDYLQFSEETAVYKLHDLAGRYLYVSNYALQMQFSNVLIIKYLEHVTSIDLASTVYANRWQNI